jgi:UDP-N-acetylglucosamine diphosphorylase / glucose-1-phosphate thymidylyltransferase / UDP-N-acetylgalactosamine diphosphorylase / glucosamine-1-phosphate N-acetyltransferase / galactosamine-1-phosphate N-acetyltransferase
MIQAIIMAAGKSTRTYPLTLTKPKPLLKVAGVSLIEHNLSQLKDVVDEVIIIVGYKKEMIIEKLGDKFENLNITYIEQKHQDGTGGALLTAKDIIKDKFIVLNGDDLFHKKDILKCLKHQYCVLGKEVDDLTRFGELIVDSEFVLKIKEKPNKKNGIANCGLYVLDKEIFNHKIHKSLRGEYEIVDFIKHLKNVNYEIVEEYWLPITYPWNLIDANENLIKNIEKDINGEIEKNATIKGKVKIGKGSIIKSGSYIEGPVIISNNCIIGPNCYIRSGTVVGNNCKIGNAVEIKNTLIGDNTNVGHLSYVGDSVIGDNVNFGAGTIIANLRHDNKNIKTPVKKKLVDTCRRKLGTIISDNVKLGIKTIIYPGRKIWPNMMTIPGQIVKKDIE